METISARIRKWGHSFGIVLPKKIIAQQRLREGSEVTVIVRPKDLSTVGDLLLWARAHPARGVSATDTAIRDAKRELWGE